MYTTLIKISAWINTMNIYLDKLCNVIHMFIYIYCCHQNYFYMYINTVNTYVKFVCKKIQFRDSKFPQISPEFC